MLENGQAHGRYDVVCYDKNGQEKWRDVIDNVIAVVGKDLALDTYLSGSAYTVTGPYIGLISSVDFVNTDAGDTMTSKTYGWLEAGNANEPTLSGTRPLATFSAASGGSKSLTSPVSFSVTGSGTVVGAFMVYGPSAANAYDSTTGVLYSAGSFTISKTVSNGDVVNVGYTASI